VTAPQPPRAPVDLRRPRDVGALIGDAFAIYVRQFRTFFLIAVAVVVPVNLVVGGVGLGQLTADYDSTPETGETLITIAGGFLLTLPLVNAMSIYVLMDLADGKRARAWPAIQRGLEVFAPLLIVILLYVGAIFLGLFALIVGAVVAFVVFGLCIQTAVVEGMRGPEALRRSWQLVRPNWLRVAWVTILTNVLVNVLTALVGAPFLGAADSSGSAIYQLAGQTVAGVLFAPPAALIITLLYFDQRTRTGS
jgi:hypothetical protein